MVTQKKQVQNNTHSVIPFMYSATSGKTQNVVKDAHICKENKKLVSQNLGLVTPKVDNALFTIWLHLLLF